MVTIKYNRGAKVQSNIKQANKKWKHEHRRKMARIHRKQQERRLEYQERTGSKRREVGRQHVIEEE